MIDRAMVIGVALICLLAGGGWTTAAAQDLPELDSDYATIDIAPPESGNQPEGVIGSPIGAIGPTGLFAPEKLAAALAQSSSAQAPAEPEHTGFRALVQMTGADFAMFPRRTSTWVILGIGAGAAAIAYPFDDDLNEQLLDADGLRKAFTVGKYLGYGWVQGGAAVGIYLIGRYAMEPVAGTRTNKVSHLGFDLLRATIVTQALTYGIKVAVRRDRPTGECCAFPSGHASVTFATAAVIERHFGKRASVPMFIVAGYVAASRLTDNRHFLSDVLFGSALGMAAGWTVVGRHGRDDFSMFPVPVRGGVALAGVWRPGASRGAKTE